MPNRLFWERARNVAVAALAGYVYTPVGLATHYHTFAVHPYWSPKLVNVANIGAHRFFRFPGRAGESGAFSFAYLGGEPIAAPHRPSAVPDAAAELALDPLALERAYEAGFKSAQTAVTTSASFGQSAPAHVTGSFAPSRPAPAPSYAPELEERGGEALYRAEKLPADIDSPARIREQRPLDCTPGDVRFGLNPGRLDGAKRVPLASSRLCLTVWKP